MVVSLAEEGSIAVGENVAERVAETKSRSQRRGSGTGHSLSVGSASTGGAYRLVAQRSIHMPHFVYLGAGEGLRVCCPWPLASGLLVVGANDGGEQEVWAGVHRLALPFPHSDSIFPKEKQEPLYQC